MSGPRAGGRRALAEVLRDVFADVAVACDGAHLLKRALTADESVRDHIQKFLGSPGPLHVLALGKAALPMLEGLLAAAPAFSGTRANLGAPASALVITTAHQAARAHGLPPGVRILAGEHPVPGAGSLVAGQALRDFVATLAPQSRLVVLLSGGGSALACLPAGSLSIADKTNAIEAFARTGASIQSLNTVRKHLSAIKGGRLGLLTPGPVVGLALSDVIGDDPSVIASGPFHPDPTTFAEALALLNQSGAAIPTAILRHLEAGAAGELPETPKPVVRANLSIPHYIVANPDTVARAAHAAIAARGFGSTAGAINTTSTVEDLAAAYAGHAALAATPSILVGNGEPRVVLPPGRATGRGGRATHLALLMARALRGRSDTAFLAAGTDDRDGSGDAVGAVVDGGTWDDALAQGLDPQAAVDGYDSAPLLARLGAVIVGPGRSNLLDLHLLARGLALPPGDAAPRADRA